MYSGSVLYKINIELRRKENIKDWMIFHPHENHVENCVFDFHIGNERK